MFLEIKDIKLSFTNARKETFNLLNGVNLNVEAGKITALVGGNGTGKTTLFNIICGFEKRYTGDIIFEGNNFNKISPHKISLMGIGRLFQGGQLLPGLTLMENMKIASDETVGESPISLFTRPLATRAFEMEREHKALDGSTGNLDDNSRPGGVLLFLRRTATSFSGSPSDGKRQAFITGRTDIWGKSGLYRNH